MQTMHGYSHARGFLLIMAPPCAGTGVLSKYCSAIANWQRCSSLRCMMHNC